MATRLIASFEAITQVLQATTATLQATQANPQRWNMMETHITALLESSERLSSDLRSVGPNWNSLFTGSSSTGTVIGRRLQAEHASCVAAYIEYLTVAVVVLRRQDAALVESAFTPALISMGAAFIEQNLRTRFGSFNALWEFTCKSDTLALFLIHTSPSTATALQPAVHSVLSWLLRFLRGGSPALEVMQTKERASGVWHQGVLMLLKIVITLFSTYLTDPGPPACRALRALPSGLLTTLCCLVCEMSPPPGMALMKGKGQHIDVIEDTMGIIGFFQAACSAEEPFREVHPELYTHAALELVKLGVLVFSRISTTHPQLVIDYQCVLCDMIDQYMSKGLQRRDQPAASASSSSSKAAACGSSGSGGIYSNEMRPRCTLSDLLLVSAVQKHSLKHPQGLSRSTNLMGCVVRTWEGLESTSQHVACLRVTFTHCAIHFGAWMKRQRRQQQQPEQRLLLPQQQGEMLELQALFLDSTRWWFTKERIPRGMRMGPLTSAVLSNDPTWLRLDAWHSLPGSSRIMEAALRGAGPTIEGMHLCKAVDMFISKLVTRGAIAMTADIATTHTSLVATLLKLISVHTHPAPAGLTKDDAPFEKLNLAQVTAQYISLAFALQTVLCSSEAAGPAKPRLRRTLHQLSAVLVVGLIRMSIWRLRMGASGKMADTVPQWTEELRNSSQHVEMEVLARQLTLPFSQPKGLSSSEKAFNKLEAQLWEGYALKHFDGRLLPGCCHLGCTKLTGVSEVAMPTLLCSGCRRVRYCSASCQRAGWAAGGHAKICGGRKGD